MKNYQTFPSNSKNPSSQALQSSEHSVISVSNNNLSNMAIERDRSSSITSLEEVIIDDPGYNGTILSSILTLCSTIFGSGMLTIPYAIATIGLVNGIIAIVVFGFSSFFTLCLLTACAKIVGGRNVSFFSISSCTYPKLSVVFDLAVGIKCFGVSVSFLVIIGELLPKVMTGVFPNISNDSVFLTSIFWITLSMLIIVPLSFQKSLSSLKYASTVSLIIVNYIAILVVYFFIKGIGPIQSIDDGLKSNPSSVFSINTNTTDDSSSPKHHEIAYFKWSLDFFRVLPIFVFAYTCHQNLLTVYNEMKITSRHFSDNRKKKTIISTLCAVMIAMTVYLTIGTTGYLTYGDTTKSNIISMYPPSNKLVLIGQSLMAIMVSISFALQCHPCRKSFGNVINYLRTMKRRSGYEPLLDAEDSMRTDEEDENKPLLFKIKSQPTLTTTSFNKDKKNQDIQDAHNNYNSNSLSSSENSVSNSLLKEQKLSSSKSYNDLYYMINDSKNYRYHYNSITIPPPPENVNTNSIESQSFELSNTLHNGITTCIILFAYTIACSVKDLGTVLSVVGATGSTTISYILPGLLYYKIKKNERGDQKSTILMKISLCISVAGVILMLNSLFFIFANV